MASMLQGTVKFFDHTRGFGFITAADGTEVRGAARGWRQQLGPQDLRLRSSPVVVVFSTSEPTSTT